MTEAAGHWEGLFVASAGATGALAGLIVSASVSAWVLLVEIQRDRPRGRDAWRVPRSAL